MKMSIIHNENEIEYTVERRKRKTLAIHIESCGAIQVYAPLNCSESYISNVVKEKGSWILRKLEVLRESNNLNKYNKIAHGEEILFLGKSYILNILVDRELRRPKVEIHDEIIIVKIREKDESIISEIIERWYKKKALDTIEERILHYSHFYEVKPTLVKIKSAKRRWGSCSSKGNLNFNWKCIFLPLELLDYIVVHEMCHLLHLDHSKNFWKCVDGILPDYKKRDTGLKKFGLYLDF